MVSFDLVFFVLIVKGSDEVRPAKKKKEMPRFQIFSFHFTINANALEFFQHTMSVSFCQSLAFVYFCSP